jgi:hypothetical protein
MVQNCPADDDIGTVEPRAKLGDVGVLRLKGRGTGMAESIAGLREKAFGGVDADEHTTGTQPAQNAMTERAGSTAELDDAVSWLECEFVEQAFGHIGELGILDFEPPGGTRRLAKDVAGGGAHGGVSLSTASRNGHLMRADASGAKRILDWVADGKTAVMFSIEVKGKDTNELRGIAYVFIDEYWYSVDYNDTEKYWLLIRGEPAMSACYHESVAKLHELVKDVLAGKQVKVPVKEPAPKPDSDQRNKEINDVLKKNLNFGSGSE